MNDLYIYEKLTKVLSQRKSSIEEANCYGAVVDFVAYKELRAQLAEIVKVEQDLKDLLERINKNE